MEWIKSNAGLFTLGIFLMANLAYMESRMGSMEARLNVRIDRVETEINKVETEIKDEIKELRNLIITLIADNKTHKKGKIKRKPASAIPPLSTE